jgi:hypothetical protein
MAWDDIFHFYSKNSDMTADQLQRELLGMRPGNAESMRSYLSRFEDLRSKFMTFGVQPNDGQFVYQCLGKLTLPWRDGMGMLGQRPTAEIPWDAMRDSLIEQDNRRRVSDTSGADALFPLGWTKKEKGDARMASSDDTGNANFGGGKTKGGGRPSRFHGKPGGDGKPPILVCFSCLKVGHGVNDCPTKPSGWKFSPEAKEKAMAKREEEIAKRAAQSRASKAEAKEKGESSSTSSSKKAPPK